MRRAFLTFATSALVLGAMAPAQAHKLKAFATAVGPDISGYAYFAPGGRAQDVDVTVSLADGRVIEHLRTDGQGEFHFRATSEADHLILVDAGDGHEATYKVGASEINAAAPTTSVAPVATAPASPPTPQADSRAADLAPIVEQAVSRQLRPLREQIDAWQEKIWFHDVLGGLGYIIGLGGLLYGLTGARRIREDKASRTFREVRR